jgi:hypothetical protein
MGGSRHEEHVALYVEAGIEFFRIDYAVYFVFRCCKVGTRVVGNGAVLGRFLHGFHDGAM